MPPFRLWEELPPELICRIGDSLDLKGYASARGACTAWRCALAQPFPLLLVVPDHDRCRPSAARLGPPTRRSFDLKAVPFGAHCVGSSYGWLALSFCIYGGQSLFSLFNPITAAEILLPPLIYSSRWVSKSKLVFARSPASDDFTAVAICDLDRLAYVTAGARRWAILDPVRLPHGDQLADIVYHDEKNRVYCLTSYGDVHVLLLPKRRRRADNPSSLPAIPTTLSGPANHAEFARWPIKQQHDFIRRRSLGPDLNAPAKVQALPFDPATSFAPPYSTVSAFAGAKNLVFCEGNLYQIWRNSSCTVTVRLPGGGRRRVAENEVFVFRCFPQRQPCWDAVTDLGGYSVFLGRNNAVSMPPAEGVPGFKGNCVYWIGGRGRDQGMVFDMATGRSTPCLPAAAAGVAPQSTVCWYFLNDMVNNCNNINGPNEFIRPVREV
ncbi:hypothetical protein QYE76_026847 [Lolium multiflorum]|uniref:KIB1-4 beta-propeller domain-containing protein n=1 Tax=Lolium multiflorum TaxID=4521 RepID=A0AAD8RH24_LOLMU|nr:hypothetical protein QYE76_026847 [Lolium multiflorum]